MPRSLRILVVDDELAIARSLARTLAGHDVAIATTGAAALADALAAERSGSPFEVVLCDFRMPDHNGLEILQRLYMLRERPILLLMTGYDSVVDAAMVADDVLLKPFRTSEVLAAIARAERARAATQRIRLLRELTA